TAVALVARTRRPGQRVRHSLQTNGILLDDEWCAFLAAHDFLVGLSVDGPPELHDAYRKDKRGQGSAALVLAAWWRLRAHGVETNLLCAVHRANMEAPLEVYRYLRDELGADHLQFIPVVARDSEGRVTARSVAPEAWGAFLIGVFDEWLARDVGEVFVTQFDAALGNWMGMPSLCVFSPYCGRSLALLHDGDVYACDHFVSPEFRLGNLTQTPLVELLDSEAQQSFGAAKWHALPETCRQCDVLFACYGECPRNRFTRTPEGEAGLNYLCAGYRAFFRHIDAPMRRMAELVGQGRAASEIGNPAWEGVHAGEGQGQGQLKMEEIS
ncbi:MAG: SPASM domain-containing protein, partial [Zoogloeaceae bacterium]|nr:SPASM domain-containing protein [Zoogloeaceae bacterium]